LWDGNIPFYSTDNGNQLTITDSTGTTIRTYDALNRVTSKTVPNIGTVWYKYDIIEGVEAGETAERTTDPKGNVTTKIYDRVGRLKAVIDGDITSTDITTYEYYGNGSRQSVTYPSGVKEEYTYYPDNTLWTLTNKYADGTVMDVYTYTYDEANNQTSKHEVINGIDKGTTSYIYDRLNRLLTVTEPNGRETGYTYDMAGNRTMELISSGNETISNIYSYNEQNRLVYITTRVDSEIAEITEYSYDHNGNQLETIVTEYIDGVAQSPITTVTNTYDKRNQLIQTVTEEGTTLTSSYNGEGLRVSKTVNGQKTYYLYEYDKVVLEVNENGTQKARNLYGTNLLMRTVDNEAYYYIYNGHADVTALIDTDGNIAATYYYDAFGNILEQTGDVDNNITYAGYQYDDETGLYYLNARMYDPKIARFLQEDTYRGNPNDPLSLNLYTYCLNNPLIYWDPTGHEAALNRQAYIDDRYFEENLINIDAITAISSKNRVYTNPVTGEVTGVAIYNSSDSNLGAYISLSNSNSFKYMPISSSGVGKEQDLCNIVWSKKGTDGYYIDVSMVEQFSGTKILHKESMINGIYTIPIKDYQQLKSAGLDDVIIADHLERYYDSKIQHLIDYDTNIFDYIDSYYRNMSCLHNSAEELGNICDMPKEEFLRLVDISGGKNLFANIDHMYAIQLFSLLAARNTRNLGNYNNDLDALDIENSRLDRMEYDVRTGNVTVQKGCVIIEGGSQADVYIPRDADGNPIPLAKQRVNGQDIPLPDPNAQGPHTVLGGKISSETGEVYRQSATFPEGSWPTANGQNVPWSEVHWSDHGDPKHHTNPHQHIFEYNPDKGGWIRKGPSKFNN
jgi:RHS repeat-associated protein